MGAQEKRSSLISQVESGCRRNTHKTAMQSKWEIYADSYSIDGQAGDTIFTVFFDNLSSTQEFPDPCDGCIEIEQFSISIRDVFSSDKNAF